MTFRAPRVLGIAVAIATLVGSGVAAAEALAPSATRASAPKVDLPNRTLTPGSRFAVSPTQVCRSGYAASVRNVPSSEATLVYARYHARHVPYALEVDHLISLELGGSNAISNLWPEPYAGAWGARTKDRLENKLHSLVCSGQLTLASAQWQEASDWVTAYTRYVIGSSGGTKEPTVTSTDPVATIPVVTDPVATSPPPVDTTTVTQPPATSPTDPYDPNGFYASSYGSASTTYCADDSAWKSLSPTYLQHFTTWADAISADPGYHLHQPC